MNEEQESKPRSLRYITVLKYVEEAQDLLMETLVEPTSSNILIIAGYLQKADIAMNRTEIER